MNASNHPIADSAGESDRLARLRHLHVLDTPPEAVFDSIASVAAQVCDTPIALVCLVDEHRQWFKANVGLPETPETARGISFCTHAIRGEHVMSVSDAAADPRFADNPLVTEAPHIRAYAGAPVRLSDGHAVGTLCVIDRRPRQFTIAQISVLSDLARTVANALEMRMHAVVAGKAREQGLERELMLAQRLANVAHHSDDAIIGKSLEGIVSSWNLAAERIFGYGAAEMIGQPITKLFPPDRLDEEGFLIDQILHGHTVPQFETVRLTKAGVEVQVSVSLAPIRDRHGRIVAASKVVRDITQRKGQERLLLESERRYRALVEDQTELLSVAFPSGEIKFANPAFARFFGRTAAECSGTPLHAFVEPSDRRQIEQDFSVALHSDDSIETESRWLHADGSVRWVAWTHRALRDKQLGVFALQSVGRDVTARHNAEEALRRSEERQRKVYEATPAMLMSADALGQVLTVSDTWLARLGWRREEVVGRPASEFLAPECRPAWRAVTLPAVLARGRADGVETQLRCRSGAQLPVRAAIALDRDAEGRPLQFLAVLEDLSAQRQAEEALERHRERLAIATESNDVGIWELDVATGKLSWSDRMFVLFGTDPAEFKGSFEDWQRRVHPDDVERAEIELRRCLAAVIPLRIDFRVVHPDGSVRHLEARATVFADTQGKASRVVGVNYDVSEAKRVQRELGDQHELLRVTLASIGDAVITTDPVGTIDWMNQVAERMTGWFSHEAKGRPLTQCFNVVHEQSREPCESPVARCLTEGRSVGLASPATLIARDGIEHGIEDSAAPIRSSDGRTLGAILVFHDVTEQRRLSQEMSFRAQHDDLTGLLNRVEFERRLERVIAGAAVATADSPAENAMMYIDLDQFKLVNDACGHSAGDQLLRQISTVLARCVRSRDTLARLGGDEFGVLLEHCSVEQARRVADSICEQMEEFRFLHDGRRFRLGTSIGLVPVDARWGNSEGPMQAADSACYAAKEAGRNRVHVWFDTDQAMRSRQGETQWGSRLELAIDEDRFVLYGQRIAPLSAAAGDLAHVEVLLRLRDADGTLVPPGAFLPAAERFHMASRVDRWVVKRVFEWMQSGVDLSGVDALAINLSGQSMGDRAFHRFVVDLISSTGVDPAKVCFEVTETAAITNLGDATAFIDVMRALGVRIALDDFGAGASSFGYLKSLAVDYLKIDGQFVRDLLDDPLDLAAVRCFSEVARVIGVKTVAEFVEHDELIATLRCVGVDFVQGYSVHRPEPLAAAVASASCKSTLPAQV